MFSHFLKKCWTGLFVTACVGLVGIFYYMTFQLPSVDELLTIQLQVPLQIYTQDKKLIEEYGETRRIPLAYQEIPKQLIDAVLATEDQRYFQHPGIDLFGLIRASVKLVLTGKKEEGGSTITMQVARSFYLNSHKTFGRKLREILLSLKIEHKLSKEKILELYLNKIFLGTRAYGVEAAAEIYYGKPLKALSLDQMAMLAGLPQAPSALNPLNNPKAAIKRRDHVLARMLEVGYIDDKAYKAAIKQPLNAHYHDLTIQVKAPYAAELVRGQLQQMYGDRIYTDNFKVYTTLDSHLQEAANMALRDGLIAYDQRHGFRGPEANWGAPDLSHISDWAKKLDKMPVINDLLPGIVVDITDKSMTVLRANGSLTVVKGPGLSWIHKPINQVLHLGDVVRVMITTQGWRLSQVPLVQGGFVALNPKDGGITALIGGFDYRRSPFNRVTSANRQPGSSFKPFYYSAALEKGYTLATVINDAPVVVENPTDHSLWRPQNDTHRFYGPTRLRDALTQSRNVVSIRLLDLIGLPYAIDYAEKFGFVKDQLPEGLSLALGTAMVTPLQMAAAYAVFSNGGYRVQPFIVSSILDADDKIIYQSNPLIAGAKDKVGAPTAITPQNAFLITSALQDVIQYGTAKKARSMHRPDLAGKTGTTQNQVDAWFAGYNSEIIAVAWVGFDQAQRSLHEWGADAALPIWIEFMESALKGRPLRPVEQPSGIVSARIDPQTGKRTSSNDPLAIFEYFMTPYLPETETERASKTVVPVVVAPARVAGAPTPTVAPLPSPTPSPTVVPADSQSLY